jgi:predicted lipoprotein with Yx(FWY)xxD motif
MKRFLLLLAAAAASVAAVAPVATSGAAPLVAVAKSQFGQILFDGRGFALYGFTKDPRGRSVCSGACAAAWPPYIVRSKPAAGKGASAKLLGTTRRRDGKLQATYAGKPLYYYIGDRSPGQVLCQNVVEFGGTWLVVKASGDFVR